MLDLTDGLQDKCKQSQGSQGLLVSAACHCYWLQLRQQSVLPSTSGKPTSDKDSLRKSAEVVGSGKDNSVAFDDEDDCQGHERLFRLQLRAPRPRASLSPAQVRRSHGRRFASCKKELFQGVDRAQGFLGPAEAGPVNGISRAKRNTGRFSRAMHSSYLLLAHGFGRRLSDLYVVVTFVHIHRQVHIHCTHTYLCTYL